MYLPICEKQERHAVIMEIFAAERAERADREVHEDFSYG